MKLSEYAKSKSVTYRTAYRWFRNGDLNAEQLPSGTIVVHEAEEQPSPSVAIYARVSSADQRADLDRQVERLSEYALAKGYAVKSVVKEVASGLNDSRPKLSKLLTDDTIGTIIVEHKARLTRFGFNYIETLLAMQNRQLEVVLPSDTGDDLVDDFVAIITSMAARIYGRRGNKNRAERIRKCIEQAAQDE